MEIELDVLWHTDESSSLDNLGLDYSPENLQVKTMTFYRIDAISPNESFPPYQYTNIHSGGEKWIGNLTYQQTKDLIEKHITHSK